VARELLGIDATGPVPQALAPTTRGGGGVMKKKILIALDGSESSMKAVEHVADVISGHKVSEVTLFHVCFDPPSLLEHGGSEDCDEEAALSAHLHEELTRWIETCRNRVHTDILDRARQVFRDRGVADEVVTVRTQVLAEAQTDVASSIIQEARDGGYDAVVLGRRGASARREFLFGSISSRVTHHLDHCAVWIVS
jgi:nucleotide-binding universal stress UspA family protein